LGLHPRAVRKSRVHPRRRCVDPEAERGHDAEPPNLNRTTRSRRAVGVVNPTTSEMYGPARLGGRGCLRRGAWLVLATDTRAGPRAAASIRGSRRESGTETADDSWGSLVCTRSGEPLRVRSQASSVGVWPVTANSLVTIFHVPSILINEKKLT
jgi:hypothetical protein